jgi:hypothetical protein
MFSMSVKSVPGCLVLIAPSAIGVPVAATPGLGPHDEVLLDAADGLLLVLVAELDEALAAPDELLAVELELEPPQAARKKAPRIATDDRARRTRGTWWNILTDSPPPRGTVSEPAPGWRAAQA